MLGILGRAGAFAAAGNMLMRYGLGMMLLGVALCAGLAQAEDDDFGQTPYVPTPQSVVDRMLEVAHVGSGDYVIDLGSGDGRMVITAAKRYGARGFGVDLDKRLVDRANGLAKAAGVSDRALFYARDLFDTDLSSATVVTIYLLPEVNLMVRPKLLATLKPGTRIVSHDYGMGEWKPDQQFVLDVPDKPVGRDKKSSILFYVVPGNAAGKWQWQLPVAGKPANFEISVAQNFQVLNANLAVNGAAWPLSDARLSGEDISFNTMDKASSARYEFKGHINGNTLAGTVRVSSPNSQGQLDWDGTRTVVGQPAHASLQKPALEDLRKQFIPQ